MNFSIRNLTVVIFLASALAALAAVTRTIKVSEAKSGFSQPQTQERRDETVFVTPSGEDKVRIFAEQGGKGPTGNWLATALPDKVQSLDSAVPVIVIGTSMLTASGRFANLIVAGITLLNRTDKSVKQVQLKWRITPMSDPVITLTQGVTKDFIVDLDGRKRKTVKCPYINFATIAEPLLKDGSLQGEFRINISVSAVEFLDGSVWNESDSHH